MGLVLKLNDVLYCTFQRFFGREKDKRMVLGLARIGLRTG